MAWISFIIPLLLAPVLLGVIVRVKAYFAGRVGAPILQPYYDLYKLFQKDYIYSKTTSWVIRVSPLIILAIAVVLVSFLPLGNLPSLWTFDGDILVFIYLLALGRFLIILSALDTGSSFEGMGASREAFFSMLIEPVILLCFLAMVFLTNSLNFSKIFNGLHIIHGTMMSSVLIFLAIAMFIVLLLESSRIPFDDPNTNLELTMIHEVMVLDHAGPDLAMILYAQSLKLWIFSYLIVQIILPLGGVSMGWIFLGMFGVAVLIGIVESIVARLRLSRIPALIIFAFLLAFFPLLLFFSNQQS
jgi:formate hydrogenlyase subunit 4